MYSLGLDTRPNSATPPNQRRASWSSRVARAACYREARHLPLVEKEVRAEGLPTQSAVNRLLHAPTYKRHSFSLAFAHSVVENG